MTTDIHTQSPNDVAYRPSITAYISYININRQTLELPLHSSRHLNSFCRSEAGNRQLEDGKRRR